MTAAIIGIGASAMEVTKLVHNDIKAIAKAPEVVSRLGLDIDQLNDNIESVKAIEASEWELIGKTAAE